MNFKLFTICLIQKNLDFFKIFILVINNMTAILNHSLFLFGWPVTKLTSKDLFKSAD